MSEGTIPAQGPVDGRVSRSTKLVTDALGFKLEVEIVIGDMAGRGQHKTYEQDGVVPLGAGHTIMIRSGIEGDELAEVASHEAYHLFYSVRRMITTDEETEADVFGHLVARVLAEARAGNVELTGAARLYRAASSDRRERG